MKASRVVHEPNNYYFYYFLYLSFAPFRLIGFFNVTNPLAGNDITFTSDLLTVPSSYIPFYVKKLIVVVHTGYPQTKVKYCLRYSILIKQSQISIYFMGHGMGHKTKKQ